jgi:hypothetical protein
LERIAKDHVQLWLRGEWETFSIGDVVPLEDGVFLGKYGSAVVFGGHLVAAWEGRNYVIPHGSPNNWKSITEGIMSWDNIVAHVPLSALQEGAKREHLDWEKDCVPRLSHLLELLSMEIEPIHICMIACNKLKHQMKDGMI